ncbi:MAG: DUF2793 domain-containing protein [Salaquimonas sp.]
METSPHLNLPYLIPSQAQKHVTHNEAIRMLDGLVQLSVVRADLSSPPQSPSEGDCYLVASEAADVWLGLEGKIAQYADAAWIFHTPRDGWLVWDQLTEQALLRKNDNWQSFADIVAGSISQLQQVALLGVGSTADENNKLAVSSPGSLFNHSGNDHRITVNKATIGDTASLVFQENWSGRAEFGLAGDNDFSVKVSPDGSNWQTALQTNSISGAVDFPFGITVGGQSLGGGGSGAGNLLSANSGMTTVSYTTTSTLMTKLSDAETITAVSQSSSLLLNLVFSGFVRSSAGLDDAIAYIRPYYELNGNQIQTYRNHLIGAQKTKAGTGQASNLFYLAIPATFILDANMKDGANWNFGFMGRCSASDMYLQGFGFSWTSMEIEI